MNVAERLPQNNLWLLAVVGRLHITVIASLGLFTFGWLFTGRYPWFLTVVCALDWYLVNLMNRVVDVEEDRANAIAGTEFVGRFRRMLLGGGLLLLVVSLVAVHLLNPAITGLRIVFHLLGMIYNWRFLPGKRRLKQIYFWKNSASAAGFMISLFGYPLATAGWQNAVDTFPPGITWTTVAFSAVFFFLFEVSYEVIYDLRDVKGDSLAGIRSYPVVHGERGAAYIVDGLIFSSMAVLAVGYAYDIVPWRILIMIIVPAIQFVWYKCALGRGILANDCIGMTWSGSCLMVLYHLWILAGLPGAGV
jgi:4-hydroxybenzoate polyprenyltransferase